jgi:glycosyltransferase involved in cell wall biosynthesis
MENSKHFNEKPMISVIIPCYNSGELLNEAVDSVFRQTFKNYEIIITDDGSDDSETLRLLGELEKKNPKLKILHQENRGPANARNSGIKISKGEFFLPLDADDTIEPMMLEKCHAVISKNPKLGFVYTYTHFFGKEDAVWKNPEYNFFDLLWANQSTVSALVRKKAWEEIGGYDENEENKYEDWEFFISLGQHGWYGEVVKEPLFNYRKYGDESRLGVSELKHDEAVRYIREKHKDLYSKESVRKIKKTWKSQGENYFEKLRSKMKATGAGDAELWKKQPHVAIGRLVPIRVKRKLNSIFGKRIFDTSYYHRSEE